MQTFEDYQARYSAYEQIRFRREPGGLILFDLTTPTLCASFSLQGGQLLAFQHQGQVPLLWLSERAAMAPGKAIRGGIPLCWPWFGPAPDGAAKPAHGFARNLPWRLTSVLAEDNGWVVRFQLSDSADTRALWPHSFEASLTYQLGRAVRVDFCVVNLDPVPFSMSYAFHSYFPTADINGVEVLGLNGCDYYDQLQGMRLLHQEGGIRFAGECDRIYVDAGGEYLIRDAVAASELLIQTENCRSAVVWNPWQEKSSRLSDMADSAFQNMLCVECGNLGENSIVVPAGGAHASAMQLRYR